MEEFKEINMEKNNSLMSGKGEKGEWITVNGAHIYIEDGQSVEEAMNKHFSKGGDSKQSDDDRLNKILTERGQSEDADFAKDTDYFGFGSLDELEKAHNAGYKKDGGQDKAADWSKVNTINQAKKIDPDIAEKKLASNIIFSSSDLSMTDEEAANRIEHMDLSHIKHNIDKQKVKDYVIRNRAKVKNKIFSNYRELSETIK